MSNASTYPLDRILNLNRRPVKELDLAEYYAEIGIYSFGRGIFHKEPRTGFEVGNKKLFLIKEDDFILHVTFSWEGAIGLASAPEDGMYGSTRFPTFQVNTDICYPKYLFHYFRTENGVRQLSRISSGSAGRNRVLSLKRICEISVELPPLAEQRRIVARIEALAGKVAEARRLRERATAEVEALLASVTEKVFTPKAHWKQARIKDFCYQPQYGFTASATFEPIGPKMLRITDIQNGQVNWETTPFCDCPDPGKYLLSKDDILFARTGATTGKSFLIQGECPEAVFASYLIRLRIKNTVSPPYLYNYFQSPAYWQQVTDKKTGTGQPNVNGSKLANLVIPVAPPEEQKQIVNYLDHIRSQIWQIAQLQANTQTELDALLPAILDKVFKGEL